MNSRVSIAIFIAVSIASIVIFIVVIFKHNSDIHADVIKIITLITLIMKIRIIMIILMTKSKIIRIKMIITRPDHNKKIKPRRRDGRDPR